MTVHKTDAYPGRRYAWYTVVMLTVAYVFSYIDRYVLGLLIEPIKADLQLSDTQIGILLGPAFAIFYVVMGLPLGWLADRYRRTVIISVGVTIWSIATAASGLAKSFVHLLLARMSVGVGEAALSPCAVSLISDSFPPERRGRPIAFYTMAQSLGAGLANLFGASVLTWAGVTAVRQMPFIGDVSAWQYTFIVVGVPGLILALVFLFMREPTRVEVGLNPQAGGQSVVELIRYIGSRAGAFGGFALTMGFVTIIVYSQGWCAPLFERTWGWSATQYALANGIVLLVFGPATVNIAGYYSDKLLSRGVEDAPLRIVVGGMLVTAITAVIYPLMPAAEFAIGVLIVNTVGMAAAAGTALTSLMNITPKASSGQAVALYLMFVSITGLLLGPTTVGLLTDNLFGEENLRYSLALLPVIYGIPVIALLPHTLRRYGHEVRVFNAATREAQERSL